MKDSSNCKQELGDFGNLRVLYPCLEVDSTKSAQAD